MNGLSEQAPVVRWTSRRQTSAAFDSIDPRLAVGFGKRELADVFQREIGLSGCGQRRGKRLACVDHTWRRHWFDARRARDTRSEVAVAAHDGIESTKHG